MKREILFRGKSTRFNSWQYGLPYSSGYDDVLDQIVIGEYHEDVYPESIGQFTGLLDKNGKKIFEGDKFTSGIVEWVNGAWRFNNNNCYMVIDEHIAKHSKVIGNIHG